MARNREMILAVELSHGPGDPDLLVGILAVTALLSWGVWMLMNHVRSGPAPPDPWDKSIAVEIGKEDATPLCHRCLTAHDSSTDFCPACGAAVGRYTNWLPYPQLFSIGHALRIGSSGEFRRSPLIVFGFFLFSLAEYSLFAPVYWILMLRSLGKHCEHDKALHQSSPLGGKTKS
jgi:hypothetical protein